MIWSDTRLPSQCIVSPDRLSSTGGRNRNRGHCHPPNGRRTQCVRDLLRRESKTPTHNVK